MLIFIFSFIKKKIHIDYIKNEWTDQPEGGLKLN